MKKQIITALLYTAFSAVLLGLVYPLVLTGLARLLFSAKANGQMISRNGTIVGSRLIGQSFTGPRYFHGRPSAAGTGYDAANSGGSNLGPTSKALHDAKQQRANIESVGHRPVPTELVTASSSGLDPDLSPASVLYQVPRIARERGMDSTTLDQLVRAHIVPRQFGLLGEPRINVLELNVALDDLGPKGPR